MNIAARTKNDLERAHRGEAWHGPAFRPTLDGVTAEMAAARPIPNAHTIWEIVAHVTTWLAEVHRRLDHEAKDLTPQQDWPPVEKTGDAAWQQTLKTLDDTHAQLRDAIGNLTEEQLREKVRGTEYSNYFMLQGAVQHHAYHAGQIAILKKLL